MSIEVKTTNIEADEGMYFVVAIKDHDLYAAAIVSNIDDAVNKANQLLIQFREQEGYDREDWEDQEGWYWSYATKTHLLAYSNYDEHVPFDVYIMPVPKRVPLDICDNLLALL